MCVLVHVIRTSRRLLHTISFSCGCFGCGLCWWRGSDWFVTVEWVPSPMLTALLESCSICVLPQCAFISTTIICDSVDHTVTYDIHSAAKQPSRPSRITEYTNRCCICMLCALCVFGRCCAPVESFIDALTAYRISCHIATNTHTHKNQACTRRIDHTNAEYVPNRVHTKSTINWMKHVRIVESNSAALTMLSYWARNLAHERSSNSQHSASNIATIYVPGTFFDRDHSNLIIGIVWSSARYVTCTWACN